MARRWKDEPAFQAVLKEIRAHNDRTAAIVAGATLEYAPDRRKPVKAADVNNHINAVKQRTEELSI
jgi:hypothetical protein